jgi:glycopeptide antibiotics resistance protein
LTDYILDLIRLMIAGIPIYVLLRILLLSRRARRLSAKGGGKKVKLKYNKLREIFLGLFAVFMMALFVFVWQGEYHAPKVMLQIAKHRLETGEGMNLEPFHTIRNYYRVFGFRGDLFGINIIGNILMFVPWGFGLALLWKKNRSLPRLLWFSAALPIFIECTQLFIGRQVDVDDFILNFVGGMLGGILFRLLAHMFRGLRTAAL